MRSLRIPPLSSLFWQMCPKSDIYVDFLNVRSRAETLIKPHLFWPFLRLRGRVTRVEYPEFLVNSGPFGWGFLQKCSKSDINVTGNGHKCTQNGHFLDIYRAQWPLLRPSFLRKSTTFDIISDLPQNGSISGLGNIRNLARIPEMSQKVKWTRF